MKDPTSIYFGKRAALRATAVLAALLLAASCSDDPETPLEPPDEAGPAEAPAQSFAQLLACRVSVGEGTMDCGPTSPGSQDGAEGASLELIVGSQHQFVRLANEKPDTTDGIWSADVTIQNLTLQPLGTEDGENPDGRGVRVFFVDEPSGDVVISNHDDTDTFMESGAAKYYEYSGSDLGTDGILAPGETSDEKTWEFTLNDEETFTFSVLIATAVPDEEAYGVSLSKVSAGPHHACAEGSDGKAYCWGRNHDGQLGDGTTTDRSTPVAVDVSGVGGVKLTNLSAGGTGQSAHTCAEGDDGKAYCWGSNGSGQLGVGTTGGDHLTPAEVVGSVALAKLSTGGRHTCAQGSDGKAYCWGSGFDGQLGHNAQYSSSTPVTPYVGHLEGVTLSNPTAGYEHTCAEGDDGSTYCWGANGYDKLGGAGYIGTNSSFPVKVDMTTVGAIEFSNLTAGKDHTCAEGDDGNAYCWGGGYSGQHGDGTGNNSRSPVKVDSDGVELTNLSAGEEHTCADGSDGKVYCWGRNADGQIGDGTTLNDRQTPIPVDVSGVGGVKLTNPIAGNEHTCANGPGGTIYCWGANARGQLGDGTTERRPFPGIVAGSGGNP